MKKVLVTGGFDPLHSGHLEYFKQAKMLGHKLIVGLNSDAWLTRKKGKPFLPFEERAAIIRELKIVDQVISFNDDDDTACHAIFNVLSTSSNSDEVIFANGGDRGNSNTPEYEMYKNTYGISFKWGVGGTDKKNSSSWILKEWSQPTIERTWGRYTLLDKGDGWQVKQLEIDPGKALSNQRHLKRSEHWHIVEGDIDILLQFDNDQKLMWPGSPGKSIDIPVLCWHKVINVGKTPAKVIEVWLGSELTEEDIERRDG